MNSDLNELDGSYTIIHIVLYYIYSIYLEVTV